MKNSTNATAPSAALYRAVWRWHFYAGLLVLPFLLWLAVTGGLYLYKPEIDRVVYSELVRVQPRSAALPLSTLVERVGRATGGTVGQIARPAPADESWRLTVSTADGAKRTAFVDPYDGRVLGTTAQGGIMQTVRSLHSLVIAGPIGNAVIEIVAGWTILLVFTGFYLWWPRGANPAIGLRGSPARRPFWRDLHASTGIVAGTVVLFLAVTGMPWSGMWGRYAQGYVATHGLGRPKAPGPAPWEAAKGGAGHAGHHAAATLPWSLQRATMPLGTDDERDIGPDRAAAIGAATGLPPPWTLTLPASVKMPYLLSAATRKAEDAHAVYIDAASGRILQDARYAAFGAGARTIEWGIATHQGQEYGEPNRLLMLFGCFSIIVLVVSAPVMWWKRRPKGGLGAPPRRKPARGARGLLAIMLGAGLFLPLTGLSMLAALTIDLLAQRLRAART